MPKGGNRGWSIEAVAKWIRAAHFHGKDLAEMLMGGYGVMD